MESQTARAAHGSAGMLDRRAVAAGDEEFLLKVFALTREDEMALVDWSEAQKEGFLRNQLAAQKTDYDARFPGASHEIVLLDDRPVGQIWIDRSEEEIRLLDIALLPGYRRRGIGTVLLNELQEEAVRARKPLRHCVYKMNEPAMALYERLGFSVISDLGMYLEMEWNGPGTTTEKGT